MADTAAVLEQDVAWRIERLTLLGFPLGQAVALSEQPDVVHEVQTLMAAGCSPRLAYRILRG